ncbi:TRAP transporter small permease [Desulfopila aestuarii]|uniref:C4-dicarboxylate transporter, DctQ subunit n=1 Tax=Desulfopila aestuarii DSM 18488 TaxID=1121416 RepID=A0A1M7Y125_9BACT|nr:TRAP transporter small permease [Desulfopila aestuarii]SHO45411.1 C4-dicarboxylate transporter, DctQ subunit [Desulfopila aestuarii DSM 18488]
MFMRILNRAEEALICLLLVSTTALVFMDVVMRFGFNKGFLWSQELTLYMSAWFVLIGASYGLKVGSHIGMDAFVKIFSPNIRRILTAIGCLLGLAYCSLILYGSYIYLGKIKKIGIGLEDIPEFPAWIAQGVMVVGFGMFTIRLLILLKDVIVGNIDCFRHADEAKDSMEIAKEIKQGEGLK